MSKTLSVIVPVYNEEASLPQVLPELVTFIRDNGLFLIMVNDGSKDGSLRILHDFLDGRPDCKIVHHKVNRGYGGAIKSGIAACETDYAITIDADGQHYLGDVLRLFEYQKASDAVMVIGSRRVNKESSVFRGIGKGIIRWVAGRMMPMNIYDLNSGMKLYDTALAKSYLRLCPDSMAYSDIIGLVFISQRHLVVEHPIQIKPRAAGKSTIGVSTAFDTILEILNVVILFSPMRIFLPLAALFVLSGLAWAVRFLVLGRGLSTAASVIISVGVIFFTIGLISEQLSELRKNMNSST